MAQHQTPVPRRSATPPVASPVEYSHQEEHAHHQHPTPDPHHEPAPPEIERIVQVFKGIRPYVFVMRPLLYYTKFTLILQSFK